MSQPNNTPKPKRKYTKKVKLPPIEVLPPAIEESSVKLGVFDKFWNWLLKD